MPQDTESNQSIQVNHAARVGVTVGHVCCCNDCFVLYLLIICAILNINSWFLDGCLLAQLLRTPCWELMASLSVHSFVSEEICYKYLIIIY